MMTTRSRAFGLIDMEFHLINPLTNAFGGSEMRTVSHFKELAQCAPTRLWSETAPASEISDVHMVSRLDDKYFPQGGTLIFVGCYFSVGDWLKQAKPERVIVIANTPVIDGIEKFLAMLAGHGVASPDLVYASAWLRDAVGRPGIVDWSPIDLARFHPSRRIPSLGKFRVGRLSRDVGGKHHPDDISLYRRLTVIGVEIDLMGAHCLFDMARLPPFAGVQLRPAASIPAEIFLGGLDCFIYRTHPSWKEPYGRVVAEAMAMGLPVVCDVNGGYSEIVEDGRNGFLFSGNDEAVEIVNYLRHSPEICQRIGDAARATVERMYADRGRFLDYCYASAE